MSTHTTQEDNQTTPKKLEDMPPALLEVLDKPTNVIFDENGYEVTDG